MGVNALQKKEEELRNTDHLISSLKDILKRAENDLDGMTEENIYEIFADGKISEQQANDYTNHIHSLKQVISSTPEMIANAEKLREQILQDIQSIKCRYFKTKKLGVGHIITTYIWLPIILILYLLNIIGSVASCITESPMAYFPYLISSCITFICAAFAFVSLITQNEKAYKLIHACCFSLIYGYVVDYIAALMTHEYIIQCIPLGVMVIVLISVLIHNYYRKRQHCLDNPRMGTIINNSENIILNIISAITYCTCILIYSYSIYQMFNISVGYGLFGVFVPIISQFAFLFETGFSSVYAFVLYFACITIIFGFALSILLDDTIR